MHISPQSFDAYWRALQAFQPDYIVGFPSSVLDLCTMAQDRGLRYDGKVTPFFPTAETVLPPTARSFPPYWDASWWPSTRPREAPPFFSNARKGLCKSPPV